MPAFFVLKLVLSDGEPVVLVKSSFILDMSEYPEDLKIKGICHFHRVRNLHYPLLNTAFEALGHQGAFIMAPIQTTGTQTQQHIQLT